MTVHSIDLPFDRDLAGDISGSDSSITQEYASKAVSGPALRRYLHGEMSILRQDAGGEQFVVAGVGYSSRQRWSRTVLDWGSVRVATPSFERPIQDRLAHVIGFRALSLIVGDARRLPYAD